MFISINFLRLELWLRKLAIVLLMEYFFFGSKDLIENIRDDDIIINEKKVYLGKFIEYIGAPYVSEWVFDLKARFEFGVLSKGYYHLITPHVDSLRRPCIDQALP